MNFVKDDILILGEVWVLDALVDQHLIGHENYFGLLAHFTLGADLQFEFSWLPFHTINAEFTNNYYQGLRIFCDDFYDVSILWKASA